MSSDGPAGSDLPDLVLHATRDIARVGTALDAEILLSTVVGSVYAGTLPDRGGALDSFVRALDARLAELDTPHARLVRAVLNGVPGEPDEGSPAWREVLGTARLTGAYAYGDRYGDQTGYLAVFDYANEELGGPAHALVILVDHNAGLASDIVVIAPADVILEDLRAEDDPMMWFAPVEPAAVATAAAGYLGATDLAENLPEAESLAANRALARARLALLPRVVLPDAAPAAPAPSDADDETEDGAPDAAEDRAPATDRAGLAETFMAAPEARVSGLAAAKGERRESIAYCLGLIIDFATARGGDPLRWSPRAVDLFLLDWVHQRAILDATDTAVLPDVLGAWVLWAGRRLSLPDSGLQATFDQVMSERPEFERLCATGERRSPAAAALAQLIAENVDLTDTEAVDAWLRAHQMGT